MTDNKKEHKKQIEEVENIKTFCCNSRFKRIGRLNYVCEGCNKNVTLDIVLSIGALNDNT